MLIGGMQGAGAAHNLTSWVSQSDFDGPGDYHADFSGVSATGDRVIFSTDERLVSADQDSTEDVYERADGVTTLLSTSASAGVFEGIARALGQSADGTRVVFETNESLKANPNGDNDSATDLYLRANGVTTLVSTSPLDDGSVTSYSFVGISPDGSKIYFYTGQKLDADDNDGGDADLYAWNNGSVDWLSPPPGSVPSDSVSSPVMSADGSTVFFATTEKLDATDTDSSVDIYKTSDAGPILVSADGLTPDIPTFVGSTPDGTHAYFTSTQEVVAGDNDGKVDIYESFNGAITLVSTGPNTMPWSNEDMTFNAVSDDGSSVFFSTKQDLVDGDNDDNTSDAGRDIYRRSGGQTTILTDSSLDETDDALLADAPFNAASPDGSRVYFNTVQQLGDGDADGSVDVYVNTNGVITRVSKGEGDAGNAAKVALFAGASADGSRVFFSTAEVMVPSGDGDPGAFDLYMRSGGTTELISTGPDGSNAAFDVFDVKGMTPDGSLVFFQTEESLLVGDNDTDHIDIYARTISSVAFDAGSSAGAESAAPSVTVSLNAPQYSDVTVNYAVTSGTAVAADYTLVAGTLTFAEGETSKALPLTITNDSLDEVDETVTITLSSPSNAVLGTPATHTFTIQDDDTAAAGFRTATSSISEKAIVIALDVDLSLPSSRSASVNYSLDGGTASPGADFTLAAGTLSFPAGTTTKSFSVTVKEDFLVEPNETIRVKLSAPSDIALGANTTHTLTILNDDSGTCHGKKATIAGTNAAETLTGTAGNDVIVGKGGNDTIKGLGGKDLVCAGGGNDGVNGGGGDDTLYGDGGNDTIAGGKGNDALDGGRGNDTLTGEAGKDKLTGQAGKDRLSGGPGKGDSCDGGTGIDVLLSNAGCETVAGIP